MDRIELIVERWGGASGAEFRWSAWSKGKRVLMGERAKPSAESAEKEGQDACRQFLGRQADRVERL